MAATVVASAGFPAMAKNPQLSGKLIVTIAVVSAITTTALGHLASRKGKA